MRDVGSCFKPFTQDWVLPAGFGAQPWLQNTWGLRAAWTILFQPHAAPIHPVQQWSRSVILSPHPPGASLLPTWTPTVMLWHHQSPLPACTHCFSSGLAAHAELKQKGRREHKAASLLARLPLWPQGLPTFLPLTAGFKII